jgi:hypothetical protein
MHIAVIVQIRTIVVETLINYSLHLVTWSVEKGKANYKKNCNIEDH